MKKYVHSGKFETGPAVLWTLAGLLIGAALGVAYAFIANVNPFIYLNLLLLTGVVFVLYYLAVFIIRKSHSRSRTVNLLATLLICLASWYVGWCFLLNYMGVPGFFSLVANPPEVLGWINEYADTSEMTVNDAEMSPTMIKLIYGGEFLIFFIPMVMVVRKKLYYCEPCLEFMSGKDYFIADTALVEANMESIRQGNMSFMASAGEPQTIMDPEAMRQYKLNLHFCDKCDRKIFNMHHLELRKKNGKSRVSKKRTVVSHTYVDLTAGIPLPTGK